MPIDHPSPEPVTRVITRSDQMVMLQVRRAELRVVKGPDKEARIELGHPGIVVGTAESCQLVLSDPAVSRRQFELTPGAAGFRLRDLQSKNGTRVAGLRIGEATLSGNEEIEVGQSRLRLVLLDGHEEFPLSKSTAFGPLLGRSVPMRRVFALLERAADSDTTVLLEGESGTGKDLAARALHERSRRRDRPFAVVDCGAMQATLVESELFGHVKGAFTGASQARIGALESAAGGTAFLDEIGELDPQIQPKLLRLLEQREIKRLGENQHRTVDVRLIAASNRDLASEVAAGRFRQDLFYRLSVLRVRLPSLRERREDIGLLARAFVQKMRPELDPAEVISDAVVAMLLNHDWPGNVRELRNVVERLLVFPDQPATALDAPARHDVGSSGDLLELPFHRARQLLNDRFEREYLTAVLERARGVVAQAAKLADIPRQTFHRLMAKHKLVKP
ncbi:MAG: sigma 54-dependent Fis family transcriptional regulator [Deltaproteobacteria bacterium]|nr:sigma 54-dependent Fis family transcriptional regulator [Deltaproteobacteria bacterium]